MPYVSITEFDADWETHLKIDAAIGGDPADGLIVHTAGPSATGTRVVDVWESKEHADRFVEERIVPALVEVGVEPGPPVSMTEYDMEIVRT